MAREGTPLRLLFGRREAAGLLESFASLAPDLGLALIGSDLDVVARAGSWPSDTLAETRARTSSVLHDGLEAKPRVLEAEQCRFYLLPAGSRVVGTLAVHGQSSPTNSRAEQALHRTLETLIAQGLEKRELSAAVLDTYREISLLYRVGDTIGQSLDPDTISSLVLEQTLFIPATARLLLLLTEDNTTCEMKASLGDERVLATLHGSARALMQRLEENGRSAILTDVTPECHAVLWVPLRTSERILGSIALGRRAGEPVFTAKDEKLVAALAAASASALQNACLFDLVQRHRRDEQQLLEVTSAVASELALDGLLQKIMSVASELLDAERSSLFLDDEGSGELWSRVAQGLETKEIRVPRSAGLVGSCFTSGEVINVQDAYENPLFNQEVDRKTGYRTRSILCMPIVSKDGRKLGVIQVLNKRLGTFGEHDESVLRAFTAQAAIALENARLFEDVLNERNYNESVLKSLSNGVITLNAEHEVAKVNEAILRVLKRPENEIVGRPVTEVFADERNRWVLDSLDKVGNSGNIDITMDADLTVEGTAVAVNLTAVPLVDVKGEAIGRMMVIEDISREKRVKSAMSRYMTKELADRVLEAGEERLGGTSQTASVLFSDIRSFTTISETMGARGTVSMLNEYFTEMVDVLFRHGGILDKYIGDAIMALFGVPFPDTRDADNAVLVAGEMMTALRKLNTQRRQEGTVEVRIGVGINAGEVIAGNIGSPKRMDYTVIGDTVNLAARLESATKYYGVDVLFSEFAARRLGIPVRCREIDFIRVKGKTKPVAVFELLDHHSNETFTNMAAAVAAFERGLRCYRARQWKQAIGQFGEALDLHPGDQPSRLYIERCRYYSTQPPPDGWDGVWVMETK